MCPRNAKLIKSSDVRLLMMEATNFVQMIVTPTSPPLFSLNRAPILDGIQGT
jgi:hypothetical protein